MKYNAAFKHRVLKHYKANTRGSGFAALALRFDVKGGRRVVRGWWTRWDGTLASLERSRGSGRKPLLTENEKKKHILKFVENANKKGTVVDYPEVVKNIKKETGKDVSVRTARRIGKTELALRYKNTKRALISQGRS
jgi:transposase